MKTKFHQFNASEAEWKAALHLAKVASVYVGPGISSEGSEGLHIAGFRPIVGGVDCVSELPLDQSKWGRKFRKQIQSSLAHWQLRKLTFELLSPKNYGIQKLIEEFYHPILVKDCYAKGISPYQAMNETAFRNLLAHPKGIMSLVREDGKICGGGFLVEKAELPERLLLRGKLASGKGMMGLVYALESGADRLRRSFFLHSAEAAHAAGFDWISWGRDQAWIESGYENAIWEKMRWSSEISAIVTPSPAWLYLHPATLDHKGGMTVFRQDGNAEIGVEFLGPFLEERKNTWKRRLGEKIFRQTGPTILSNRL